jgi:hypothetical protein
LPQLARWHSHHQRWREVDDGLQLRLQGVAAWQPSRISGSSRPGATSSTSTYSSHIHMDRMGRRHQGHGVKPTRALERGPGCGAAWLLHSMRWKVPVLRVTAAGSGSALVALPLLCLHSKLELSVRPPPPPTALRSPCGLVVSDPGPGATFALPPVTPT